MNNNYNQMLRELRSLSQRLSVLLQKQEEENRSEAQGIALKINQLVAQLKLRFSSRQLRKTMGAVALLFGLAAAQPASAQSFAAPVTNPFGLSAVTDIAIPTMVDLDNDGDLDIMVGEAYGAKLYFQNTGTAANPQYAAPVTNPFGLAPSSYSYIIAFADLDNDGDLDALIGEYYGTMQYYMNTGTASSPQFAAGISNPFGLVSTIDLALPTFADLDNDGDMDLLVGEYYGSVKYFENTGTASSPQFAAPVTNPFGITAIPYFNIPHLVDLDNDGDFDLLSSDYYGDIKYFQNTGTASNPQFAAVVTSPFGLTPTSYVSFITSGDIDNDGDTDLLFGGYYGNMDYYKNTSINIGIGELASFKFKLYPNPTKDVVRIDAGTETVDAVEILDVSGNVLAAFPFEGAGIDLSELAAGIYLLKLTSESGNIGFQKISKL